MKLFGFDVALADVGDMANLLVQVHGINVQRELAATEASEVQQIVNEAGLQFDIAADHGGVFPQIGGQVNFGLITLRWGMGFNNTLWDWHIGNARALAYGEQFKRKDGTLICLPYADVADPLATSAGTQVWYFRRAIPVRWTGPQFDASSSQVAIEGLEIAHEGLERWFPANMEAIAKTAAGAGTARR
jgi:phage tail-like protein